MFGCHEHHHHSQQNRTDLRKIRQSPECGNDPVHVWVHSGENMRTFRVVAYLKVVPHLGSHPIAQGDSNCVCRFERAFGVGQKVTRQLTDVLRHSGVVFDTVCPETAGRELFQCADMS